MFTKAEQVRIDRYGASEAMNGIWAQSKDE